MNEPGDRCHWLNVAGASTVSDTIASRVKMSTTMMNEHRKKESTEKEKDVWYIDPPIEAPRRTYMTRLARRCLV